MVSRTKIGFMAVAMWLVAGLSPATSAAATCLFDFDGDGVCDSAETSCEASGGTKSDRTRSDSDGDFIRDDVEVGGCGACGDPPLDTDGDGTIDACDTDTDGDGYSDRYESGCTAECTDPIDTDGDGIPDFRDLDSDGDGLLDEDEAPGDFDGDGIDNVRDPDSDNDGILDGADPDPLDPSNPGGGDDGDGTQQDGDPVDPGFGGNGATGDLRLAGGGGCSSTPSSTPIWLLLFALALIRARRAVVPMLAVLAIAIAPGVANAQGVDAHALRANLLGEGGLAVPNTDTLPARTIRVGVLGDLAGDALELRDRDGNRMAGAIDRASAATLGIAVGLPKGFEAQLVVPLSLDHQGAMASSHSAGLRDIGIGAKWGTTLGRARLAVAPELVLPTGSEDAMTGDGTVGARLQVLGDAQLGALRIGGAAGARLRADEPTFGDASVGNQLLLGAIADFTASRRHRVHLVGEVMAGAAVKSSESPAEVLGSVQWFVGDWVLVAGGGAGLTRAIGSPEWRALAGVAYTVGAADRRPPTRRFAPAVAARPAAATAPASDAAPPAAALVAVAAANTDRDGDGIADDVDHCPDQPETANGFDDDDGCPDETPRFVFDPNRPLVLREIEFETSRWRILPTSYALLDDVAESIQRQPHVRLRVEGHTDSRGRAAANLTLSQQRALAVVNYLVAAGVDPSRLEYEGFGSTRPIASNRTPSGQQQNRRVEFRVISTDPAATNP